MGYHQKATVDINSDFLRELIEKSQYSQADVSRVIGMADNYIGSLLRYGAGSREKVKSIAILLGVPFEQLLKQDMPPEEPPKEERKLPDVSGQTVNRLYEQLVRQNSRLDDIEKELRRLQSMELRQDKLTNQVSAMIEMMTRWSDQITKISTQAASCATTLLRLRAMLEGKKP